jgi:bifunctional DNA-binding transcriptional regulator/antitoxin component of YhaV-PrlF toxin-antitoxin module
MITSKVSPMGWTRLPCAVRETLGLKRGDSIRYVLRGDEVVMLGAPATALDRLVSKVRRGERLSGEEVDDATMEAFEAEAARDKDRD